MAKLQITGLSSATEKAEAADQLRSAQQDLQQWITDKRNDPSTPREVFEGVDYGPLISATDIDRQGKIIANQYDYINYGSQASTNATGQFFVDGFGTNSNSLSSIFAPLTSLNPVDDSAIQIPSDPSALSNVIGTSGTTSLPSLPSSLSQNYPTTDVGSSLGALPIDDARLADQFDQSQLPNFSNNNITPSYGNLSSDNLTNSNKVIDNTSNSNAVNSNTANNDDSGSVSGTGVDSGYVRDLSSDTSTTNNTDKYYYDPERSDSASGSTEVTDDEPEVISPDGTGQVDVSELAKPKQAGSGSSLEENKPGVEIRPNVLHNYASWTYSLGLYMLTPVAHTNITKNGGITDPVTELSGLLIKSGGTGGRGVLGDKRDYYLENLKFISVVGQNSRTARSSNNFDISFDIVEPYGVAFMAELVQLASLNGIDDHFEVPYLLEIKFRGFDDNGNVIPEIPNSGPKYIPIKIINITFKVTSAATIYTVTAVPYAHTPLQNQHEAFIQESMSIEGQTFNELMAGLFNYLNEAEKTKAKEQNRTPDEYSFVVHDTDLKTSQVGFDHITDGKVVAVDKQSMSGGQKERVQITGGSTIKSVIQAIAAATDFGAKYNTVGQTESANGNENKPLRVLKVLPVITELTKYNTSTKRYAKKVTYRIDTQKMYGFVLPDMPGAGPQSRGWQKEYNWIFTGKNKDILDFQADYNAQYFVIRNVLNHDKGKVAGTPAAEGNALPDDGLSRAGAGGKTYSPAIVPVTNAITDSVQNSHRGAAHQLASDHMDNVLNNPGADMMTVNLDIIGDPDWIPQDRSILPFSSNATGDALMVNGSIATDTHDVLVMLKFKTPRDYNPTVGLMQIETDQTFIQGLYRVIMVESNFADGKFEQKLQMVRIQKQISNDSKNIPELTAYNETIEVTDLGPDPNRVYDDEILRQSRIRPSNQVTVTDSSSANAVDDPTPGVSSFPQQSPSSARAPGQNGWGQAGDEFNALDAISEQNRIYRQNY